MNYKLQPFIFISCRDITN